MATVPPVPAVPAVPPVPAVATVLAVAPVPSSPYPILRQVVLDTTDARALADFYRELLGYRCRPGDEPPAAGETDARGSDWLLLLDDPAGPAVASQQVRSIPRATSPDGAIPQQLHLDLTVRTVEDLDLQHSRVIALRARVLLDRAGDGEEPLRVDAGPAGHPFCLFVDSRHPKRGGERRTST